MYHNLMMVVIVHLMNNYFHQMMELHSFEMVLMRNCCYFLMRSYFRQIHHRLMVRRNLMKVLLGHRSLWLVDLQNYYRHQIHHLMNYLRNHLMVPVNNLRSHLLHHHLVANNYLKVMELKINLRWISLITCYEY